MFPEGFDNLTADAGTTAEVLAGTVVVVGAGATVVGAVADTTRTTVVVVSNVVGVVVGAIVVGGTGVALARAGFFTTATVVGVVGAGVVSEAREIAVELCVGVADTGAIETQRSAPQTGTPSEATISARRILFTRTNEVNRPRILVEEFWEPPPFALPRVLFI